MADKIFKFKQTFGSELSIKDLSKGEVIKETRASSEENLRKLSLPWVLGDGLKNDLLGLCLHAAIVNVFNKNGVGILSALAPRIRESFIHKPLNVEHDKNLIVGHVFDAAMSDRTFGKVLSAEDVLTTSEPFDLIVNAFVYRLVAGGLNDVLDKIKKGDNSVKIYASWELGFDKYCIAVGRTAYSRKMSDCDLITDEKEIERLSVFLKDNEGTGRNEYGSPVFRVITDEEAIAIGLALTVSPAADVAPLYVFDYSDIERYPSTAAIAIDDEEDDDEETELEDDSNKKCATIAKINSQINNEDVLSIIEGTNMNKDELIKTITESVQTSIQGIPSESVASIMEKVADMIVSKNQEYLIEKQKSLDEVARVQGESLAREQKIAALEESAKTMSETLAQAQAKLSEIEAAQKETLARRTFDERMTKIDAEFDLTDDDRKFIAADVTVASTDEDFEKVLAKYKVLLSAKTKQAVETQKVTLASEVEKKLKEELERRGIVDPLEEGKKPVESGIPSSSSRASEAGATSRVDELVKLLDRKNVIVTK
jgi:hypothetical protein